jgi:hypothetical protein
MEFLFVIKVFFIISYIIGVLIYVYTETMTNVKFHKGGFLNMGYTTCDNKNATTKIMWKALIWPILFLWWSIKAVTVVLHLLLGLFLLIFGIKYKDSQLYKKIENKILDSC